ncbi:unnamed protein product [Lactuca saligna]|uniref:Uncharacterized protein n=1 Tax=Lactuca saligna TaxID=75948 RepID=A0AA36A538_LACSI|nr:unnamed protein product [Lactuca saligna]
MIETTPTFGRMSHLQLLQHVYVPQKHRLAPPPPSAVPIVHLKNCSIGYKGYRLHQMNKKEDFLMKLQNKLHIAYDS